MQSWLLTWLEQCLAEGGTVARLHTSPGQVSLQKYLQKKPQLHPEENRVREQSLIQVCGRVSRECEWLQGAEQGHPLRWQPDTAQQLRRAQPRDGGWAGHRALGNLSPGNPSTTGRGAFSALCHGLLEGRGPRAAPPAAAAPPALARLPGRLPLLPGRGGLQRAGPPPGAVEPVDQHQHPVARLQLHHRAGTALLPSAAGAAAAQPAPQPPGADPRPGAAGARSAAGAGPQQQLPERADPRNLPAPHQPGQAQPGQQQAGRARARGAECLAPAPSPSPAGQPLGVQLRHPAPLALAQPQQGKSAREEFAPLQSPRAAEQVSDHGLWG